MSSHQDAEPETTACAETIVVLHFGCDALASAFGSKEQAIRWFKRWLTTLDPSLQRNLPFRTLSVLKNGWALKVRFQAMQGAGLDQAGEALARLVGAEGSVKIMSEEDVASELLQDELFKQKQTARVGVCGNYEKTAIVVDRLSQYFGRVGKDGPTKKQRRCALAASELMNRSHLIGSAGLKEARVDDEDEEA